MFTGSTVMGTIQKHSSIASMVSCVPAWPQLAAKHLQDSHQAQMIPNAPVAWSARPIVTGMAMKADRSRTAVLMNKCTSRKLAC